MGIYFRAQSEERDSSSLRSSESPLKTYSLLIGSLFVPRNDGLEAAGGKTLRAPTMLGRLVGVTA
jgi:hypothetical protein